MARSDVHSWRSPLVPELRGWPAVRVWLELREWSELREWPEMSVCSELAGGCRAAPESARGLGIAGRDLPPTGRRLLWWRLRVCVWLDRRRYRGRRRRGRRGLGRRGWRRRRGEPARW